MDYSRNTSPRYCWQSGLPLPLLWWAAVTGWVLASSAAALRSASAMPASLRTPAPNTLLRLHVQTLQLRPNAGPKPPYAMRGPTHLHVV